MNKAVHNNAKTLPAAFYRLVLAWFSILFAGGVCAHHPIQGKFNPDQPRTLTGIVTLVDWRNPHAHVFMNVGSGSDIVNWAVELESPILLKASGWDADTLRPGDAITVQGTVARNGTRQIWGEVVTHNATGRQVYTFDPQPPILTLASPPVPRWPDGKPALGTAPGTAVEGYWSYPSKTALVEDGVSVAMDRFGMLRNIEDADNVAPLQPWALELYKFRQQRYLQDDPMYRDCKPPGGPRQYQSLLGFQLLEDKANERIFVLMGSGNHNYRIIYLDGRDAVGNVGGDDDNPLFYGRSIGHWEGDTLVVETGSFNEGFWFSNGGLPHTNLLAMTERFTRRDLNTLEYEVTINDPGAYTRPWTASWTLQWVGGEELPFHLCQENRP